MQKKNARGEGEKRCLSRGREESGDMRKVVCPFLLVLFLLISVVGRRCGCEGGWGILGNAKTMRWGAKTLPFALFS